MPDSNEIVRVMRVRQCQMRAAMDRRGISLKGVSFESGIPYSSLLSYFPDAHACREPALMPVSAQYLLCGAIPQDILSLLLPDGHVIVKAPVEMDHDQIEDAFTDYLQTKAQAHHVDSECGREIGPNENRVLTFKAVQAVGGVAA